MSSSTTTNSLSLTKLSDQASAHPPPTNPNQYDSRSLTTSPPTLRTKDLYMSGKDVAELLAAFRKLSKKSRNEIRKFVSSIRRLANKPLRLNTITSLTIYRNRLNTSEFLMLEANNITVVGISLTKFTLFGKLPSEIRVLIWKHIFALNLKIFKPFTPHYGVQYPDHRWYSQQIALYICWESRTEFWKTNSDWEPHGVPLPPAHFGEEDIVAAVGYPFPGHQNLFHDTLPAYPALRFQRRHSPSKSFSWVVPRKSFVCGSYFMVQNIWEDIHPEFLSEMIWQEMEVLDDNEDAGLARNVREIMRNEELPSQCFSTISSQDAATFICLKYVRYHVRMLFRPSNLSGKSLRLVSVNLVLKSLQELKVMSQYLQGKEHAANTKSKFDLVRQKNLPQQSAMVTKGVLKDLKREVLAALRKQGEQYTWHGEVGLMINLLLE